MKRTVRRAQAICNLQVVNFHSLIQVIFRVFELERQAQRNIVKCIFFFLWTNVHDRRRRHLNIQRPFIEFIFQMVLFICFDKWAHELQLRTKLACCSVFDIEIVQSYLDPSRLKCQFKKIDSIVRLLRWCLCVWLTDWLTPDETKWDNRRTVLSAFPLDSSLPFVIKETKRKKTYSSMSTVVMATTAAMITKISVYHILPSISQSQSHWLAFKIVQICQK